MSRTGIVFVLMAMVVWSACKKEVVTSRPLDEKFAIEDFNFPYLTAKAKLKYQDGEQKLSVTANFRIQRDSVVWVSLSPGLGIEAARIMADVHGVYVMDKINKEYRTMTYEELSRKYGAQIGYPLVEALLVGNALMKPERRRQIKMDGRFFEYTYEEGSYGVSHYVGRQSKKVERLSAYQVGEGSSIVVNYGTFQKFDEQKVPLKIRGRVKFAQPGKEDAVFDIEYSKLQPQEEKLSFPFHVSDKYTRK